MPIETLTPEELDRLVQAVPDSAANAQERAALYLLTVEGLRTADLSWVTWSGYGADEDGTPCLTYMGKAGRERRRLAPLTAGALDALRAAARPGEETVLGIDPDGARGLLYAHADRAGVRLRSVHAVRNAVRAPR